MTQAPATGAETPKSPETPPEGASGPSSEPPQDETKVFDEEYVSKLRDEAAKHRREKKEAEERNSALAERLLSGTIESTATDMADPADLLLYVESADLLGEDGLPDPERIRAAQTQILEKKPHLRSREPRGDIDQGPRGEAVESFSFNDWLRSAAN